jgi:cold shock CspA family protein
LTLGTVSRVTGIGWILITPDDQADAKVFCHGSTLKRAGIHDIAVGDRLSFDIIESRKVRGKTEAANIASSVTTLSGSIRGRSLMRREGFLSFRRPCP